MLQGFVFRVWDLERRGVRLLRVQPSVTVPASGFTLQPSSFTLQGLGFGVWDLEGRGVRLLQASGLMLQPSAFMLQPSGFTLQGFGFTLQPSAFMLRAFGFRVWGLGFRAESVLSLSLERERSDSSGDAAAVERSALERAGNNLRTFNNLRVCLAT